MRFNGGERAASLSFSHHKQYFNSSSYQLRLKATVRLVSGPSH